MLSFGARFGKLHVTECVFRVAPNFHVQLYKETEESLLPKSVSLEAGARSMWAMLGSHTVGWYGGFCVMQSSVQRYLAVGELKRIRQCATHVRIAREITRAILSLSSVILTVHCVLVIGTLAG